MSGDVAAMGAQALVLHGQGRVEEALTLAWQAAAAHPNSPLAQYTYASLLRESGRARPALAVVNQALRLSPAWPDALVLRGDLQRSLSGAYLAEADYLQALRIQPNHALAVHNLAVSRLRMGTITKALRGLVEAGRLDPGLGPPALANITLAVAQRSTRVTASVVLLASALIVVGAMHDDGLPTALPRIIAAILTVPLLVAIGWTARTVPGPTLRAVLRSKWLLPVRLLFLAVAAIAGMAVVAGAAGPAGVAGPLLLIAVVGLTMLGWMTGA